MSAKIQHLNTIVQGQQEQECANVISKMYVKVDSCSNITQREVLKRTGSEQKLQVQEEKTKKNFWKGVALGTETAVILTLIYFGKVLY